MPSVSSSTLRIYQAVQSSRVEVLSVEASGITSFRMSAVGCSPGLLVVFVLCGLGGIASSTQQSEVMAIAPLPALGLLGSRRRKISCVGLCF
jgi:hypothetical protein